MIQRIRLFGALQIDATVGSIRLGGSKVQSLLAFLLLHPHTPHTREYLADLLWPDATPQRVRRNFSDTLYRLRQALGEHWLRIEPDKVALNHPTNLWVDIWEFQQRLTTDDPAALTQATELYLGDLLPEIYDDWILPWRVNLREQYLTALEKLVELQQHQHNLVQALHCARRLIIIEPLREYNQQIYLRLLGRLHRRSEALTHYDYLQALLQQELGLDPMPETQAIITAIRQDDAALPSTEHTPFVGRIAERAHLLEAIETALAGQGGLQAIEGEAGIGKSRLLREVAVGARWRGAVVAAGNTPVQPAASPLFPLAQALAETLTGARMAQLEILLPAQTLARLAPLYPAWQKLANLPDTPPLQARQLFHRALVEFFQTLASLKPHIFILDDLHRADPALWAALAAVAPILPKSRLLFLLGYRRPAIEQNPGWETLQQWERAGQLKVTTLKSFTETETRQVLPPKFQAEAAHVQASTGGNPFFITEMLHSLEAGRTPYGDTILARAELLPGPVRQALEVATVLGAEVSYPLWAAITDLPPHLLAEAGEQLENSYFLQPARTGYVFSHDLIHTSLYEHIKPARRRRLHRLVADHLEKLAPNNLRARAFHLDRAQAAGEAVLIYRQAGEQDQANFAFKEAEIAFDRALALMPARPAQERVEMLLALARVCDVTGNRPRQQSTLTEARLMAHRLGDEALITQTLLLSGQVAAQTGQVEVAANYLDEALSRAQRLDDEFQQIEAFFLLGDLAARRGQLPEAERFFETAQQHAQKINDHSRKAHALRGLGIVARQMGKLDQAITWLEKALLEYQQTNDLFGVSMIQANLLGAYYYLGLWDRLLALAGEALAVKKELGDRLGEAVVLQNYGLGAYALGDFAHARALLEQAIGNFEAVSERRTAGLARNVLGLIAEGEGNLTEAKNCYEAALSSATEVKAEVEAAYAQHDLGALYVRLNKPGQAISLLEAARATWLAQRNELLRLKSEVYLGLARLALGQHSQAKALAETGWNVFQKGLPDGEQRQAWLWQLYQLHTALQQPDRAEQLLRAAYEELQRQASAIADTNLRRNFFECVPLNQEIVTACDGLAHRSRYLTVTLARQNAPLGRPLLAEEMVTVRWTISAPEDEAIASKSARRQNRLRRLLAEAAAQEAAPTDNDLAEALGVSRRTILRDMADLAGSGFTFLTRRRVNTHKG